MKPNYPTGSKLHLMMKCRSSVFLNQIKNIPSTGSSADIGTRIHSCLEAYVDRGAYSGETSARLLNVQAEFNNIDFYEVNKTLKTISGSNRAVAEVAFQYDTKNHIGSILAGKGRAAYSGVESSCNFFYGTIDAVIQDEESLAVIDWKTGRGHVDHPKDNWQILLAIVALRNKDRPNEQMVGIIHNVVTGIVQRHEFSGAEVEEVANEIHHSVNWIELEQKIGGDGLGMLATGDHCKYCPSWKFCPAKTAAIKMASGINNGPVDDNDVVFSLKQLNEIKDIASKAEAEIREYIDMKDNKELRFPNQDIIYVPAASSGKIKRKY